MQRSTFVCSGLSVGLAVLMHVSPVMAESPAVEAPAAAPVTTEAAPAVDAAVAPVVDVAVAPAVDAVATTEAAAGVTPVEATTMVEAAPAATSTDNVVVSVDGVSMTQSELDKRVESAMKAEGVESWPADLIATAKAQYEEQVKELFVTRTVLANEARRQNITTTEAEVDEIVEALKGRMKPGRSLDDLIKDHGITMEQLRKELADDHNIEKLIDQTVLAKNAPSEDEMKAFYAANAAMFAKDTKVRASHILIKTEPTDTPDVKNEKLAKIQALRTELINGADFAEVARKNSDCPSSSSGGDLGEFGAGMMVKPFEEAAFKQEVDTIGEVVETQFGYHLIKVTGKTAGKAVVYEDVKNDIRKQMQAGTAELVVRDFIDGLRAKASITGLTPSVDAAGVPAADAVAEPVTDAAVEPVTAPVADAAAVAPATEPTATPAAAPVMRQ